MKYIHKSILLILLMFSVTNLHAQQVEKINNEQLIAMLESKKDKLHVVNFWATWCSPCVKELPQFISVAEELENENIEFIFVNLDFPSQYESRLLPFMERFAFRGKVVTLAEVEYNDWIPLVNKDWQGEIPSTLFFNHAKDIQHFHSDIMNEEELHSTIKKLLSKNN